MPQGARVERLRVLLEPRLLAPRHAVGAQVGQERVDGGNAAENQIVHAEDGCGVDKVLIGGRLVVSGGRALGVDKAALAAKAQAAVDRLHAVNARARHLAELIGPTVVDFCRGMADSPVLAGMHRLLPAQAQA